MSFLAAIHKTFNYKECVGLEADYCCSVSETPRIRSPLGPGCAIILPLKRARVREIAMTYHVGCLRLLLSLFLCLALSAAASAREAHDRTQVGSTIIISAGQEVGDATCFGCSIRVRGRVSSDATAFGGSVVVEDQGQVDGDVTAFAGGIRLGNEGSVKGDVTVFGGRIQRDPTATVGGDVTAMGGPGWIVLILGAPLLFFALFVALIVWIVRRLLRPAVPVTA